MCWAHYVFFNTDPKNISESQEDLIKRIASNIAHLLDLQVEQRSLTAEKIIKATDILSSEISEASLVDFKNLLLLEAELPVNAGETMRLQRDGFCELNEAKKNKSDHKRATSYSVDGLDA